MQLLLALRVAWARFVERGQEPLPLFLDEALTTSDPERFSEVAASLSHLARAEGRQVVYLSAQPTDLLFWRQALGHEPKVVDLARIRFGCSTEPGSEAFALPERDTVPVPEEGEAPEAWAARAGVPPVNPWEDPGGLHLFHLLRDDPFRLYDFMSKWGLQVQGQLESILVSPAGDVAVPNPEDRRRLAARCRIARRWIEGWRKGRGRPVDRGVMERSGAVSDTFLNQVAELAQEIGGEPRALLRALPGIPWYRNAKVKELEQWLEEEGYLLPGTLLTASEREAVVLREAAGLAEPGEVREVVQWLEAGLATDQR